MLYIHDGVFVFVTIIVILFFNDSAETTVNPVSQDKPSVTVICCSGAAFQSYDIITSKHHLQMQTSMCLTLEIQPMYGAQFERCGHPSFTFLLGKVGSFSPIIMIWKLSSPAQPYSLNFIIMSWMEESLLRLITCRWYF